MPIKAVFCLVIYRVFTNIIRRQKFWENLGFWKNWAWNFLLLGYFSRKRSNFTVFRRHFDRLIIIRGPLYFRAKFWFSIYLKVLFVAVSIPQTALQNNFSHGDMAETVEGTLGDLLYKIGSILGPKWGKTALIFIKMGLFCLKFGRLSRNYPMLRNMKENYDFRAEFWNYEAKYGKNH